MKQIVATGIVLLSLCSVAEAHRLSGTATYYGGSDALRTPHGFWGGIQLCRNDGGTPDAAFRDGAHGPEERPVIQVTVTDRGPLRRVS